MTTEQTQKEKNHREREKMRKLSPAWKDTKATTAVIILVMAVTMPTVAFTLRPASLSAIALPASARFLNKLVGGSSSLLFLSELDIILDALCCLRE
jgi:hypothetical protein